jgi:hypothetical protein
MWSFINNRIHDLLRLKHKPVPCSDDDKTVYLKRAVEVQHEIKTWLKQTDYEKVGLGQNCNSSWYLKTTKNKRASYPFDWIFTTPEIIEDVLSDDFEAFLDKSQLIPQGLDAGHERYHDWLFGHRNPASSRSDYEFFGRCVERWTELIESQKPVVFVTVVLNESYKRKRWEEGFSKQFNMPTKQKLEGFQSMMNQISEINPNCKFLFIEQHTEKPFELSVTEKNEQAFWLKFNAIDKNTGVQYLHSVDDEVMKTILLGLS